MPTQSKLGSDNMGSVLSDVLGLGQIREGLDNLGPTEDAPYGERMSFGQMWEAMPHLRNALESPIPEVRNEAYRAVDSGVRSFDWIKKLLPTMWNQPAEMLERAGDAAAVEQAFQRMLSQQAQAAGRYTPGWEPLDPMPVHASVYSSLFHPDRAIRLWEGKEHGPPRGVPASSWELADSLDYLRDRIGRTAGATGQSLRGAGDFVGSLFGLGSAQEKTSSMHTKKLWKEEFAKIATDVLPVLEDLPERHVTSPTASAQSGPERWAHRLPVGTPVMTEIGAVPNTSRRRTGEAVVGGSPSGVDVGVPGYVDRILSTNPPLVGVQSPDAAVPWPLPHSALTGWYHPGSEGGATEFAASTRAVGPLGTYSGGVPVSFLGQAARSELARLYPGLRIDAIDGRANTIGYDSSGPDPFTAPSPDTLEIINERNRQTGWGDPRYSPDVRMTWDPVTRQHRAEELDWHPSIGENFFYHPDRATLIPTILGHEYGHATPQDRSLREGMDMAALRGVSGWDPTGKESESFADWYGILDAVGRGAADPAALSDWLRSGGLSRAYDFHPTKTREPHGGPLHPADPARAALMERALQASDIFGPVGALARVAFDPHLPHRVLSDLAMPTAQAHPEDWGMDPALAARTGGRWARGLAGNISDTLRNAWDKTFGDTAQARRAEVLQQDREQHAEQGAGDQEKSSSFRLLPEHAALLAEGILHHDVESLGRFL